MKQILDIILTFFTFQDSGLKDIPKIKNLVQEIEKNNELQSKYVGIAGVTTDQYKNFEKLRDKATFDELMQLLEHKNSVVKGYASWALADKMYPKLADILAEFLRTGETATTQNGCIVSEGKLASEFYDRIFNQHLHNELSKNDSLFFQSQIQQLDSVIIYGDNEGYLLCKALSNIKVTQKNYERIRHLAFKEKNSNAMQALVIYHREQDIEDFK